MKHCVSDDGYMYYCSCSGGHGAVFFSAGKKTVLTTVRKCLQRGVSRSLTINGSIKNTWPRRRIKGLFALISVHRPPLRSPFHFTRKQVKSKVQIQRSFQLSITQPIANSIGISVIFQFPISSRESTLFYHVIL